MVGNNELVFHLLENGLDFIESALGYLKGSPDQRCLKYAIVHLQSGIELILKEKLRQEHWTLIFDNVSEASVEAYKKGCFKSVLVETSIKRLKNIVNISIDDEDDRALNELKEKRNRLLHFGITDSFDAVQSVMVKVLDFTMDFIDVSLDKTNLDSGSVLLVEQIREGLGKYDKYVVDKLADIGNDALNSDHIIVVKCPVCLQDTFVVEDKPHCLFCGYTDSPENAVAKYIERVLGFDWHREADGEVVPVYTCPECECDTFVDTGDSELFIRYRYVCFNCGTGAIPPDLGFCEECGQPMHRSSEKWLCNNCWDYKLHE
jgi:hypothetical protein